MVRSIPLLFCLGILACSTPGQVRQTPTTGLSKAIKPPIKRTALEWKTKAENALKDGDFSVSERALFEAYQLDSKLAGLRELVLSIAETSGRRAKPDVMWTFRQDPTFSIPRFWAERGRHLFKTKQYSDAVADLRRAVSLRPGNSIDWAFLARAYGELRKPAEAAEAGLRSLSLVIQRQSIPPRKRWALLQFIVANGLKADRTDLVADAGLLWVSQPNTPDIVSFLRSVRWPGEVMLLMYRKVLKHSPTDSAARFELGRILFHLADYDEAADVLRLMSRRSPRWGQALEIGAEAAHRSGQHERAVWMLAQLKESRRWSSRRRAKGVGDSGYRIIRALMRGKRYAWARSEAHLELQTHSKDPELLYLFAVNTALAVSEKAGFDAMLKVLDIAPNHVFALNFIGYTLAVWNRELPRAEALLTRALNAQPTNPAIMDSMGWLHYRKGQFKVAAALLRRAFRKQPESGTIAFHLACALRRLGKIEESEALYRQALTLDSEPQERKRFESEWSVIK